MRTEDDLRNHYDHLADAASPDRVADRLSTQLNRSTPSRRGRSLALALGAAAAVTAVAVAVPLALRGSPSPEPAAPVKDPTWQSWLTIPTPPGTDLSQQLLKPDYQLTEFRGTDLRCTVVATRNKEFTVAALEKQLGRITKGAVDVAGRPGHILQVGAHEQLTQSGAVDLKHRIAVPVLRNRQKPSMVHWQAADGLWAGVSCYRGPFNTEAGMNPGDAQALQLARSIRGVSRPVLLPFRIGKLPAGTRISAVQVQKSGSQAEYKVEVSDSDSQTGYGSHHKPVSTNKPKVKNQVILDKASPSPMYVRGPLDQGVDLQIALVYPQSKWYDGQAVRGIPGPATWSMRPKAESAGAVMIGTVHDGYLAEVSAYRQNTAEQEARQAASDLTLADPRDSSRWYDPSVR